MDPQHINPKDRLAEFTQQDIPLTQRPEQREAIIESRKNRLRSAQLRQKKQVEKPSVIITQQELTEKILEDYISHSAQQPNTKPANPLQKIDFALP